MKSLLIVFCVLFLTVPATAETPLYLGPQMGLHLSSLSVSPSQTSYSGRTTFMFGGVLDIGISPLLWISPQINYVSGGGKTSGQDANGQAATLTINLSYIEFAPLVKFKFGKKDFKPYAFAGPKVGILVGASQDYSAGGQGTNTDIKDNVESLGLSIMFGGGTDYFIDPNTSIFGDLNYSIGLTNINKTVGSTTSYKTSGFMIIFGARFRID